MALGNEAWKRRSTAICCAACAASPERDNPRVRIKVANARGAPALGITILLASLSMISPLSIDTFLPSFPTIAKEFGISDWQVQQIITAYLLPFAFFALVHGPLSDAGPKTV